MGIGKGPPWTTSCEPSLLQAPIVTCLMHNRVRITLKGPVALQNAEIFTLTYGSMVRQLLTDLEDVTEVNMQLDKM